MCEKFFVLYQFSYDRVVRLEAKERRDLLPSRFWVAMKRAAARTRSLIKSSHPRLISTSPYVGVVTTDTGFPQPTAVYLIPEKESLTLIGSGTPKSLPRILKSIQADPLSELQLCLCAAEYWQDQGYSPSAVEQVVIPKLTANTHRVGARLSRADVLGPPRSLLAPRHWRCGATRGLPQRHPLRAPDDDSLLDGPERGAAGCGPRAVWRHV